MSSTSAQIAELRGRLRGVETRQIGVKGTAIVYAAAGAYVAFGCKVTPGADATNRTVSLEGQAAGDAANLNPDIASPPLRAFEFPNIASVADGAFVSEDQTGEVDAAPTDPALARYDIAYVFLGPSGSGFDIATGTPSAATKDDYDLNGLRVSMYDPALDPALPAGALPVGRIYVNAAFTGVGSAQIADIRDFDGRLKGDPLLWSELTQSQKDEIIDPAVAEATTQVLADNEAFKAEIRTLHWLGV